MALTLQTLRSPILRTALRTPALPHSRYYAAGDPNWSGRHGDEHATNRTDELDVQAGAAQSGKRERASGDDKQSQATTEGDRGNQNEQAKKDLPESPDVVIGMNDERGGMGHKD